LRTHKSKVHLVCFDYVENIFSDISPRWVNNFETISKKTQ
jgi:uncharacterized protein YbdZ (MbtH family)